MGYALKSIMSLSFAAIFLSAVSFIYFLQENNLAANSLLTQSIHNKQSQRADEETWLVTQNGNEMQISYGSDTDFPQYGALHLEDSFFRLNHGPSSGWGTSVILLPAFWSGGTYYQGAPISATWHVENSNLVLSITGTIASLDVSTQVSLSPPETNSITAHVTTTVGGSVSLDNRPGEAFKPVTLSSMHISPTIWDTRLAYANCRTFSIPVRRWIIDPQPQVMASNFSLLGGTSDWKANAPTIWVLLDQSMQVAGWVTESNNPNDDNVSFWAASNEVLNSWSFKIVATSASDIRCQFLSIIAMQ